MPDTNWRDDITAFLYERGYGPWTRAQILWLLQAAAYYERLGTIR
jgi:hypothetical protein